MFNMECCTLTIHDRGSLKSFRGDSDKRKAGWFSIFVRQATRKEGRSIFLGGRGEGGRACSLQRNYVMVVIFLFLLFNYDNLTFKLHQKNAATVTKDGFLLVDSKLQVCQE